MRKLVTMLLALVAACFVAGCDGRTPTHYIIPDGYVGWVRVDYGVNESHAPGFGVKKAPSLPMRNGAIIVELPASGHLVTSTDMQFGSAPDQFFYTKNGKLTPLSQAHDSGMVWNKFNGRLAGAASQTKIFFIGSHADYMAHGYQHERPRPDRSSGKQVSDLAILSAMLTLSLFVPMIAVASAGGRA